MSLRKIPLHWKIILGMFLGVLFGFIMSLIDGFTIYLWDRIPLGFGEEDLKIDIHYLNRDHGWSTTKFKNLIAKTI